MFLTVLFTLAGIVQIDPFYFCQIKLIVKTLFCCCNEFTFIKPGHTTLAQWQQKHFQKSSAAEVKSCDMISISLKNRLKKWNVSKAYLHEKLCTFWLFLCLGASNNKAIRLRCVFLNADWHNMWKMVTRYVGMVMTDGWNAAWAKVTIPHFTNKKGIPYSSGGFHL